MARPREFDADLVLQHAMELFWASGYQATSIDDLVEQTGISRYGLYTVFGDKHDLFLKAVDFYDRTAIKFMLSPLETDQAGLEAINAYFAQLVAPLEQGQSANGCLIGNTALELTDPPDDIATRIALYFDRLESAFANAISNSIQQGTLAAETNTGELASFLIGVVNGYLGMLRTGSDFQAIRTFVRVALQVLGCASA